MSGKTKVGWIYGFLKKVFADDNEVLGILIEKWRKNKLYELLYAMYASIYMSMWLSCMLFVI